MDAKKEILKIVVVGHVDHGKSTVIGRLCTIQKLFLKVL